MKKKWMGFKRARKIVRQIGLTGYGDWKKYCSSGKKLSNIRAHPEEYCGWVDVYDWLGISRELRKYKVNDNYFKKWSSDMAYILGFWFADGSICIKKGIFAISQNTKDRYILEKISLRLGSSYPIFDGRNNYNSPYSKISIRSKEIIKDIIKMGGKERKSLDVKFPDIPKKYLPDFIRGLWDGDGTVFYRLSSQNKMQGGSSILSGSLSFIRVMQKVIKDNVDGISGHIYNRHVVKKRRSLGGKYKNADATYYTLVFSINDSRRLRDFMYAKKSRLMLKRKYLIFKKMGAIPALIKYITFEKASNYIRKMNFRNVNEWKKFANSKKMPNNIPRCPYHMYKGKGWRGMRNWLGLKPMMLPFLEARKYATQTGIKTYEGWRIFAQSKKRPRNIPSCPDFTYKNKGYSGIRNWLGIK